MAGESSPAADAAAPKRKAKPKRKHAVGLVILAGSTVLALVTALGVVFFYRHLNGNIDTESLDVLGEDRPAKVYRGNGEPLNILVMGDDTREGVNNDIDGEGGGGSDTTILVHLSADRTRSYAISIPRDSIVTRPECEGAAAATDVMWNAAYAVGGPLCTVAQLEENTDIFVDHFVVVDFNGFGDMVDAVDGVPVCVPEDIKDPAHQIFVPAGDPSLLTGDEALDYVRARYVGELAEQNDISRIKRQQAFIAALIRKVKSAGTLTRLDRVVGFLDAATRSLTTDTRLGSVTRIGKIAMQMQNIGLENVKFVTVPTAYYPSDSEFRGKVYWTPEAEKMWELVNKDEVLPRKLLDGAISAEPPATSREAKEAEATESESAAPESTETESAESESPESEASSENELSAEVESVEPSESDSEPTETESASQTASPSETASESETVTPSGRPTPRETTPGVCA